MSRRWLAYAGMSRRRCFHCLGWVLLASVMTACLYAGSSHAKAGMQLERVVLLYRHGVRTPLPGEVQLNEVNGQAWPLWKQPPSELTPHGAEGARLMGAYDRHRLDSTGLFTQGTCPDPAQLWFWANTDQRTIASAQALAEGFAADCKIAVGHLPQGSDDPLFHPIEAKATDWNAQDALASIQSETGGPDALTARHADALAVMAEVMGCGSQHSADVCDPHHWHGSLTLSPHTHGISLSGPIFSTSGTAEVILMAYAEGFPPSQVGWGRTTPARLEQLSQLHALLFDIYARPVYMAERVASVMSHRIIDLLQNDQAPRLSVMVGSDNNIVALASVLGLHFKLPDYAQDDPPIGGALGIELWRNQADGKRYVRVFYQAQSLQSLRTLQSVKGRAQPSTLLLQPAGCKSDQAGFCPLADVISRLQQAALHVR